MKKHFKRRQFLVNPTFQFRIMGWMTLISLAPVFVFFTAHHYFFWQLEKLGLDLGLGAEHVYFKFLEVQSQKLFIIFIICSVLTCACVLLLGLMLSHRIAGPIHRLKSYLRDYHKNAKNPPLSFREGDYFGELPAIVNECLTQDSDLQGQ